MRNMRYLIRPQDNTQVQTVRSNKSLLQKQGAGKQQVKQRSVIEGSVTRYRTASRLRVRAGRGQ
jgi:hypothetical protein